MKKNIYSIKEAPTGKIWRNNSEPADKSSFEFKYNDEDKYITGNKDSIDLNFDKFDKSILEEFPEYLAGWDFIITNTGLTCFYNMSYRDDESESDRKNFIIYDMFDNSEEGRLEEIKPDISMMLDYNFINQPLNVRKVNFKNNAFIAERTYYNSQYCAFYNCDAIEISNYICETIDNNSFFTNSNNISTSEKIYFNYKPIFVFKIYDTTGTLLSPHIYFLTSDTEKNDEKIYYKFNEEREEYEEEEFTKSGNLYERRNREVKITVNNSQIAEYYSDGIYFVDLSQYEKEKILEDGTVDSKRTKISVSLSNCGSGYLEVI